MRNYNNFKLIQFSSSLLISLTYLGLSLFNNLFFEILSFVSLIVYIAASILSRKVQKNSVVDELVFQNEGKAARKTIYITLVLIVIVICVMKYQQIPNIPVTTDLLFSLLFSVLCLNDGIYLLLERKEV